MEPLNYKLDVQNPFDNAIKGYQVGAGLADMQLKRDDAQLKREELVRQRELQIQMQKDLGALSQMQNPTARDYATVMTRYPQISEHLKKGFDILQPEQQRAKVDTATQAYAALNAGQPEIAAGLLERQAEAYRNSGNEQEAKATSTMAQLIRLSPQTAKTTGGLYLSSVMGADKFAATFPALGKESRDAAREPDESRKLSADADKARADAVKAGVDARYAEPTVIKDLEKKGWDIKKIENDIDISKQNSVINAMKADIDRETNALRREELRMKINEASRKRDESIQEHAQKIEASRFNIDNMLNTLDRVLKNPALNDVLGTLEGSKFYPNAAAALSNIANPFSPAFISPNTADKRTDAIRLIETLASQAFLSQIPQIKGTGSLSNVEGDKLQEAFQNFSRQQSESQFRETVAEAKRLLLKARVNLVKSFGIPNTQPDRPASDNRVPGFMGYDK